MSAPITLCTHSNHLFDGPIFCERQAEWKRISIVAFHIFTLGIPLALYHLASWCFSICRPRVEVSSISTTSYPPECQKALEFVQKKLKENPGIPIFHWAHFNKPVNQDISRLYTLYCKAIGDLKALIRPHGYVQEADKAVAIWNQKEVVQAADECMKMGYAISVLTLEDLPAFTERLSNGFFFEHQKRTFVEALTRQDSYQFRAYFICPLIYNDLRMASTIEKMNENDEIFLPLSSDPFPEEYRLKFFTDGTIQNSWNILYNDFCSRVGKWVPETDLKNEDQRFVNWTKLDTAQKTFAWHPDMLPT